jgi:hypothetical protein
MVVIAIPSAKGYQIRRIIGKIEKKNIKIKIIPGVYELLGDKVSVSRIREVKVEDLLNREPINLKIEKISKYLKGKKVMITDGLFYMERKIKKEFRNLKLIITLADIEIEKKWKIYLPVLNQR